MPDLILRKTEVQCYGKLRFWSEETPKYTIKVAQGFLGKPNADKRSRKAHEAISKGSGDHAGHLIARRFGGPDAACNLARQNYMQNRGGGTYYTVEDIWAEALDGGAEVYVTVREKTLLGKDRTFYRDAEWTITSKTKGETHDKICFLNTESDKTRAATGLPTKQYDTPADVIPLRRS
jgi:DNA/RNA non-specific endonuclease